ncbi:MAG: hypothetical protein JRM99_05260, partial [Nitrososphaerota archaeon]|nr:hypothetical protein [Nitrososphaerota archaeon]
PTGTSNRPPDVTLAMQGNDQYAPPLESPRTATLNEIGAVAVTVGVILLSGLAIYASVRSDALQANGVTSALGTPSPVIGPKTASGALILLNGDLAMAEYDYAAGPSASPNGALNAFYQATYTDMVVHSLVSFGEWVGSWI